MQSIQASFKQTLNTYTGSRNASRALRGRRYHSPNKEFMGSYTPKLRVLFAHERLPPLFPENTLETQGSEDHMNVESCLATIIDPLWKHVCVYVIHMMGAASFLKIWDSALGEICSQSQSIEIHCHTEKTAQFIRQYDFVILGSLQPYFPALKQLNVKTI